MQLVALMLPCLICLIFYCCISELFLYKDHIAYCNTPRLKRQFVECETALNF
jgi:hypothetical protein